MSTSMRAGGIHWQASLDADNFTKNARKVRDESTRMRSHLQREQSFLKGLKGAGGEESAIGQFGKAFRGAGALGGLTAFSMGLADSAKHIAAARKEFNAGAISASEFHRRLAEGIPIVGQYARLGRELGEAWKEISKSPAMVEQERIARELAARGKETADAQRKVLADNKAAHRDGMGDMARKVAAEQDRHRERIREINAEKAAFQAAEDKAFRNTPFDSKGAHVPARLQYEGEFVRHNGRDAFQPVTIAQRLAAERNAQYLHQRDQLLKIEKATHQKNLQNIKGGPSPWLPIIRGVDDFVKGTFGGVARAIGKGSGAAKDFIERGARERNDLIRDSAARFAELKKLRDEPFKFTGDPIDRGSREDIMSMQQRVWDGIIKKPSDEQLMKQAIDETKKQTATAQKIYDRLGELLDKLQVKKV